MSENMPSHSFVARYPNYVQDASSTCICGEIRDSSVHPDRFDDERVKEVIRRREKARQVAAEKGWMAAEVPTWSEVDYLLSLLPVQPAQDYRQCVKCRHEGLFSNSGTILCQKPVRTEASKDKSTADTHAEDFEACGCRCEFTVQPAQQEDDGWVTFGRIKTDIEDETETFERIPVQPAASAEARNDE